MTRLVLASSLLCAFVANAYPIAPRTLWALAHEAEVIVVATVLEFRSAPRQPTSFSEAAEPQRSGSQFVRLKVSETLKGQPLAMADVVTNSGFVCPAPPRFLTGRRMVAFLSSFGGEWHVTALSYGVLYPSDDDFPAFKRLLSRAVTLQQNPVTDQQRLEWALEAAATRATRWHGVYELQSSSDSLHHFYDRTKRPAVKLTKEQRLELARRFVAEPSADHALAGIIELVDGVEAPGLEAAFVGAIELLLADDRYTAIDAMLALVKRKGGDAEALIGKVDGLSLIEVDANAAWKKVRAKYPLPDGAKVPRRERIGVGEDSAF